jgi:hypothetical protein
MLAISTVSALSAWSRTSTSPTARPAVLARRKLVSPGTAPGAFAAADVACSVVAWVAHVATGPSVSICAVMVLNNDVAATGSPALWALASGAFSVTFGAGAGGAGVTIVSIVAVSCAAPVPMSSSSPGLRPVVLCSRIAVAPAAAAWLSVVFVVAPREMLPELSIAR